MQPFWARVDLEAMAIRGTQHYLEFQYKSLRWFSVISRTLIMGEEVVALGKDAVDVFYSSNRLGRSAVGNGVI